MAVTLVQSKSGGNSGGGVGSLTLDSAPTAGNALVCIGGQRGVGTSFTIVSPSGFVLISTYFRPDLDSRGLDVYVKLSDGTETTVTFGTSAAAPESAVYAEFSGLGGLPALLDDAGVTFDNNAAPSMGSVTPGDGKSVLFLASYWKKAANPNPGPQTLASHGLVGDSGFASLGNRHRLQVRWDTVASASGSYAPGTWSSSGDGIDDGVTLHTALGSGPLVADFSGTPLSGNRPLAVQFTDLTSPAPTQWEWDFGDSNVSTAQNPLHIYANAGTYTVTLIARDGLGGADTETKVAYVVASVPTSSAPTDTPDAIFWVDWDNDGFSGAGTSDYELARMLPEGVVSEDNMTPYVKSISWQRGGQQDLIGGQTVGTLTAILNNTDGRFTPDNAAGPLFGKLDVGRRVWLGGLRSTATYKGLWAGYVKEIVPLPGRTKEVQLLCHDAFGLWQEARVAVDFTEGRTAYQLRQLILTALGLPPEQWALAAEPYVLAVSGADTKNGLQLLDQLNSQSVTRHLILPSDDKDDWFVYKTLGRNDNLGIVTPEVTLDEDDIVGMSGYRRTFQTVVNYQEVTPHQIKFSKTEETVWEYEDIPFSVTAADNRIIKANHSGWVRSPRLVASTSLAGEINVATYSPGAPGSIRHYGQSSEIALTGVGLVTRLRIMGYPSTEPGESVEFTEDIPSQDKYGLREGTPVDAALLRSSAQALAITQALVIRSNIPRTRPQVSFRALFDKTLTYDHGDTVAQSLVELDIVARRYEIVGVSGSITEGGKVWDFGWTYLETPYQTTLALFKLNVSTLNSTDILGF